MKAIRHTFLYSLAIYGAYALIFHNEAPQVPVKLKAECMTCKTGIDTTKDKALVQWLDTEVRVKFKRYLILKEKK